jgi:transposase-like protein
MSCPRCNSELVTKDGTTLLVGQRFRFCHCGRRFTRRSISATLKHACTLRRGQSQLGEGT